MMQRLKHYLSEDLLDDLPISIAWFLKRCSLSVT
jgi:hypothetical protein